MQARPQWSRCSALAVVARSGNDTSPAPDHIDRHRGDGPIRRCDVCRAPCPLCSGGRSRSRRVTHARRARVRDWPAALGQSRPAQADPGHVAQGVAGRWSWRRGARQGRRKLEHVPNVPNWGRLSKPDDGQPTREGSATRCPSSHHSSAPSRRLTAGPSVRWSTPAS